MKRIAMTLTIFAVLLLGVAFYRHWVNVSVANPSEQRTELNITVDKAKVEEDVNKVKEKAQDLKDNVAKGARKLKEKASDIKDEAPENRAAESGGTIVQGMVIAVKAESNSLQVAGSDKTALTIEVTPETTFRTGDKDGKLTDLKPADPVSVVYVTKDEKHYARSITLLTK